MSAAHVILIGLRGSGKSTVGRLVASCLQRTFVDLDEVTPRVLGCQNVAEAWTRHGEQAFRVAEATALAQAIDGEAPIVISLGGGTPTAPGAPELLLRAKANGTQVMYLRAQPAVLAARLHESDNSHRPSLTGHPASSIEEITTVYEARDALYCAVADMVLEVGGRSEREVLQQILARTS